ncbi:MAG: carboxypeptidase-like regulatory domain-containing protein [Gemmatimonadota bacterium]|nr:carboxypeptidase-like regulatory domain-containing protein [Gemmatimonadota bacterium]
MGRLKVDRNSIGRRTLATVVGALVSAGLLAVEAGAQRSATLTGRVIADSGGVPIGNAGIRIPELERLERADRAGGFQVENLAPGTYVVIAEAPGFRARRATVTLAAGESRVQDFTLARGAQLLSTVNVRAKAPPRVSPKMVDFERRRQRGYGRFITRAELERAPGRQLEHALRAVGAAARFVRSPDGQTWLISSRQVAAHHRLSNAGTGNSLNTTCPVQVVMDGMVISSSTDPRTPRPQVPTNERGGISDPASQVQGGDDSIDLNMFFSDQFEGVEFYADATMTPLEYRTPAAVCGTLVLWTRDK